MICLIFHKLETDARNGPGMSRSEVKYFLLTTRARRMSAEINGHGSAVVALGNAIVSAPLRALCYNGPMDVGVRYPERIGRGK
jgi:hypothetical protein